MRDEANYIGPTINKTARLRDLAHGGQTVLSGDEQVQGTVSVPKGECTAVRARVGMGESAAIYVNCGFSRRDAR